MYDISVIDGWAPTISYIAKQRHIFNQFCIPQLKENDNLIRKYLWVCSMDTEKSKKFSIFS